MNAISLFSGCGGFDLGFLQAGGEIVAAYELNTAFCEDYERVIGRAPIQTDLTRFDFHNLPSADGLIAGPPCQDFSKGGLGLGERGKRNLFPQTLEAIAVHRPRWFVLENVFALAKEQKHWAYFMSLIGELHSLGYWVSWRVLNAADYGVPQMRRRVFIVGRRDQKQFAWPEPTHLKTPDIFTPRPWVTIRQSLAAWLEESHEYLPLPPCFQKIRPSDVHNVMFAETTHAWRPWRSWDEPSLTIRAAGKRRGLYMLDGDHSFTTDRRAEAMLQTLPPVIKSATAIGNAVPPTLAKVIFGNLD